MADTNETTADIITEMRIFKCRNLETGELELCNAIANHFADRLEAALKRERTKIEADALAVGGIVEAARKRERGNPAALREALKDIRRLVEQIHFLYSDYPSEIHEIARKVNAALAEPVRNCDVGTAEEQYSRMFRECHEWMCADCKQCDKDFRKCALSWAQKPYVKKEGGAK